MRRGNRQSRFSRLAGGPISSRPSRSRRSGVWSPRRRRWSSTRARLSRRAIRPHLDHQSGARPCRRLARLAQSQSMAGHARDLPPAATLAAPCVQRSSALLLPGGGGRNRHLADPRWRLTPGQGRDCSSTSFRYARGCKPRQNRRRPLPRLQATLANRAFQGRASASSGPYRRRTADHREPRPDDPAGDARFDGSEEYRRHQ